ncbi:MAG: vitamin K epoxide reductase family protein, partial [Anaerolineae bacterium]
MRLKRVLVLAAIVLSAGGVYLSAQLLAQHLLGQPATGLAAMLCGPEGGGCDRVMNSRWSVVPPYPPGSRAHSRTGPVYGKATGADKSARGLHIPVPVLGLLYFSFLLTWFLGVGCPNERGRRWQIVPFLAVLAGNIGSGIFIYLMARVIRAWCPECMVVHAVNFALLVLVVVTCPRRWRATGLRQEGEASSSVPDRPEGVPHPTVRLALVTIALAMSLWLMGIMAAAATSSYLQVGRLKGVVEDVCAHPSVLAALYAVQARSDIPIRPDDPYSGPAGGAPDTLVVFTDMTCPSCKEFETFLATEIRPLFGDRLRV